jgi:HK97 family phage portal protein
MVAEAAASVSFIVVVDGVERADHPLIALLERPNARQSGPAFLESVFGHLLVAGNAYIEAGIIDGRVRELHALRPDRVKVVPGADGWPEAYDYAVGAHSVRFRMEEGVVAPLLHVALFNPVDDHYGFSPMEAAAVAIDTHQAASHWNKALLDNAARPSGALVYSVDGANMSDDQFQRLKSELETSFQGAANAGRPMLLEGGLDWKPLSLTPKDMDFSEAKAAAAREVALAFGVPPLLLGLPGDNTHANYAEANRALWRQTVIPLATRLAKSLAQWLEPSFGGSIRIDIDLDRIEALASERESLWRRVSAAAFLDENEKREAVGYGAKRPPKDTAGDMP